MCLYTHVVLTCVPVYTLTLEQHLTLEAQMCGCSTMVTHFSYPVFAHVLYFHESAFVIRLKFIKLYYCGHFVVVLWTCYAPYASVHHPLSSWIYLSTGALTYATKNLISCTQSFLLFISTQPNQHNLPVFIMSLITRFFFQFQAHSVALHDPLLTTYSLTVQLLLS